MNSTKNKSTSVTQKRLTNLSKKKLSKAPLIKKMIVGKKNTAGRGNLGKITVTEHIEFINDQYRLNALGF